jgi:LytTr DNA-binding domain
MPTRLKALFRGALLVVGLSAAFTWFGVYNVNGPAWLGFSMWLVTIGTGMASSAFIVPFIFGTRFEPWPLALRILAGAALIAVPVTLSLYVFGAVIGRPMATGNLLVQYVYVLAVCVIMVVGGYALSRVREAPSGSSDLTAPDAARAFLARLPLKYRQAELHAVSSEDHYLRVHTNLGEELILMRLADAVRELDGGGGLQVHRSWWVAKAAVRDVKRQGGKVSLVLPSGKEVPVSRSFMAEAKAAGLA